MGNERESALDYYKEKIIETVSKCDNLECLIYLEKFNRLLIQKREKEEAGN